MSSIEDLPDLTVLTIFDNLPLLDLFHIDEVCVCWQQLKSAALARRKHLIIVSNESHLECLEDPDGGFDLFRFVKNDDGSPYRKIKVRLDRHALYAIEITPMMVDKIIEKMPNLKVIRIIYTDCNFNELWKVKYLLHHYRHQLVEVTIWFWDNSENEYFEVFYSAFKSMVVSLIHTLNNMKNLKSLDFNIQSFSNLSVPISVDLSIAKRLKKLSVRTFGITGEDVNDSFLLKKTLEQYCETNENLEALYLENPMPLETALLYGPRVSSATKLVNIEYPVTSKDYKTFKKVGRQFANLQFLLIDIADVSIAKIAKALAPCRELVHLTVYANANEHPGILANEVKPEKLTVLPSVKALTLFIKTGSHKDFEKMNLDVFFPNVQAILLRHNFISCQECKFQIPTEIEDPETNDNSRQVRECLRLARISFKKFTKLSVLEANVNPSQVNALPEDMTFTKETLDTEVFSDNEMENDI